MLTLNEVLTNPFTGVYKDLETDTLMFTVCGVLVTQVDADGKVLYSREDKKSPW